ncbi:hypothetical protein EV715DRAFT_270388 [Schizophyllum commune]
MAEAVSRRERWEQLQAEQAAIDAELQRLTARRQDIAHEMSLLAPVNTLPTEILGEVFMTLACYTTYGNIDYIVCILCHVCTKWRTITMSMPMLWNSIDLAYIEDIADPFLSLQLQLSGSLPLHLKTEYGEPSNLQLLNDLPDTITSRVESIRIEGDGGLLSTLCTSEFPSLVAADITILHQKSLDSLSYLARAPALRELDVTVSYPCTDADIANGTAFPITTHLGFDCLTQLTLCISNEFPICVFLPALSHLARTLQELNVLADWTDWEETVPAVACNMPVLHTVTTDHCAHRLLMLVTAPVLATLDISNYRHRYEDPAVSLLSLLCRSQPPIRSFRLYDPMDLDIAGTDKILQCLERMDECRHLVLHDANWDPDEAGRLVELLDGLTCVEGTPPLLPELNSFSVEFGRGWGRRPEVLSGVIPSLSRMRQSRENVRVCAGRTVAALKDFQTSLPVPTSGVVGQG